MGENEVKLDILQALQTMIIVRCQFWSLVGNVGYLFTSMIVRPL